MPVKDAELALVAHVVSSLAPSLALYFALSVAMTFSLKFVYTTLDFHFPLLFVELLLVLQWIVCCALVRWGVGRDAAPSRNGRGAAAPSLRRTSASASDATAMANGTTPYIRSAAGPSACAQ